MWRNYRISLSFANLVYVRAWADLIPIDTGELYHRKTVPGFHLYFALVGDVILLSLLIFAVLTAASRLRGRARVWVGRILPVLAIAAMALATSFLRTHLLHYASARIVSMLLAVMFLLAAGLAAGFPTVASRWIKGFALAATPCLAVTFLAPLYYLSGPSPLPADPPLAQRLAGAPAVRVVWVVFDDWDERLTFENPLALPPVPALMNLATRSFAATHALAVLDGTPVVDMATANAIPSLLYGKLLLGSTTEDIATRQLLFADHTTAAFGKGDSVFARMRARGWNSAAAGWYLPYCRVFAPQLSDCYWDVRYDQATSAGAAPPEAALDETRMLFETEMYSPFGRSLVDARHFGEYEALTAAARRYAADPSIGLTFIHFNVPHAPFFYNPELGRFGRKDHPDDLYIDGLKWVDRAVSEILGSLDSSGLASKTAIVLSSDHPARLITRTTPYVPFIVHLPGEDGGMFSNREFSAIGTADLVLAMAAGDVRTPADVESFLIGHH